MWIGLHREMDNSYKLDFYVNPLEIKNSTYFFFCDCSLTATIRWQVKFPNNA